MSFKPYSTAERARLEKLITDNEKVTALAQSCISSWKAELEQGQWCYDTDWASIPLPEPDCYLCAFRVPVLDRCSKNGQYGTVCLEYKHFTEVTR